LLRSLFTEIKKQVADPNTDDMNITRTSF